MKTTVSALKREILLRLVESNFEEIEMLMDNGDTITIAPCCYTDGTRRLEDCEYFLVNSPSLPWLGGSSLATVADQLFHYSELCEQNNDEKSALENFRRMYLTDRTDPRFGENFSWYSDWHKDVYGYRPRFA